MIYYIDLNFRYPDLGSISFFRPQDDFKWKKFELQSYRYRRKLQFLYKFNLHLSSYNKVTIFENEQMLTVVSHDVWRCYSTQCGYFSQASCGMAFWSKRHTTLQFWYSFAKFEMTHIFFKNRRKVSGTALGSPLITGETPLKTCKKDQGQTRLA
jgi:hypothetical protein